MPLPDQTPRLPKWPFLIGDAALLFTAWFISNNTNGHLTSNEVMGVVSCVAIAAVIGAIPFISDYARKQDEALDERQRSLESLARTITSSAEQISIAANGFNEISDLAQKNLKQAEQLPIKLQEKIADFQARALLMSDLGKKDIEKLEIIADKVAKAAIDCTKAEAAVQKQIISALSLVEQLDNKIAQLGDKLSRLSTEISKPKTVVQKTVEAEVKQVNLTPVSAPVVEVIPPPTETASVKTPDEPKVESSEIPPVLAPTELISETPVSQPETTPATVAPKPERKRAARKQVEPKVEVKIEEEAVVETPTKDEVPALSLEFSDASTDDQMPVTGISADGATRITVTAYIGIGNRLFIRGDGPGLSWDKGIPLQFVSIGKWRWETMDADKPVSFKLYKNDDVESTHRKHAPLEPGSQVELTATF
jgi:hypothetical protein